MKRDSRVQGREGRNQMPSLVQARDQTDKRDDRSAPKIQRARRSRKRDHDNDHGR